MSSTWQDREQRMLEAIQDAEEAVERAILFLLVERLELDDRVVRLTLGRLSQAGYVAGVILNNGSSVASVGRSGSSG